ncbi:carbohydrate ABC transporter permease [Mesorhizobium neociceri]|uniref:Sugar ABC transporter permease n=1 Tax=Mesorhizobium neociceri TaxID=1307853 RepID=A0A838BDW9_9HYPH|nr:sugar ABC transporter permease [Mesorhizobium neociceri]MBA1144675.1 sugar ABC transporter permease [Mesorhizobium neociceri]
MVELANDPVAKTLGALVAENGARLDKPRFSPSSLLLLFPAAALLIGLFIYPVGYSVYLGFTNLQLIGPNSIHFRFTGLQNVYFLLSDHVFYRSIWLTLVFVVGSGAVGTTILGLVIALALQSALTSVRMVVTSLAIVAWTLPPAAIAIIWYAATTQGGIFPVLFGYPHADVLYDHAMLVVSLANTWSLAGLATIIFSAALRNVPQEMLEAAKLEDANAYQRLTRLVLPILKPTILTSALLMTLLSFGNFTLIYLMTQGGPGGDSNILPVYSYLQGFTFKKLGYAALLGDVIVLISGVLGIAYVWLAQARRRAPKSNSV